MKGPPFICCVLTEFVHPVYMRTGRRRLWYECGRCGLSCRVCPCPGVLLHFKMSGTLNGGIIIAPGRPVIYTNIA